MKLTFLYTISKFFFYCFFVLIIFQASTLFFTPAIYSSGFFNPFLSFRVYISDLFLLFSLLFLGLSLLLGSCDVNFLKSIKKYNKLELLFFLVFFSLSLVSFTFSFELVVSLFYYLRFLEFFIVYFLISRGFVSLKFVFYCFFIAMFFASVLGTLQFFLQSSLGLHFLGEPFLFNDKLGVAKINFSEFSYIRAYSFFSHPNVFAAYLVFSIFILLFFIKKHKFLILIAITFFGFVLFLTFSRSALFALLIGGVLFLFLLKSKKVLFYFSFLVLALMILIFSLGFFDLFQSRLMIGDVFGSIERLKYFSISADMFISNPFGVGLGNYTLLMQDYIGDKLFPWFFQPVHNTFILITNELGIVFSFVLLLSVFWFFYSLLKSSKRSDYVLASLGISILILSMFDHYFWTLYQGQFLIFFYLALVSKNRLA